MIPVSGEYKNKIKQNRRFCTLVRVRFADGATIHIDDDTILSGGLSIETATSQSDSFEVGSIIIGKMTLRISNADGKYTPYDFTGAELRPQVGLELGQGRIEWLEKGVFASERAAVSGSVWTITAYDSTAKLDKEYTSSLPYPAAVRDIVNDACNVCGLALSADGFANENYVIPKKPDSDGLTFRAVLSYAAQITGNYGCCNHEGKFGFKWYDTEALKIYGYDGGKFDHYDIGQYTSGDVADGGNFTNHDSGDVYDDGVFGSREIEHNLYHAASLNAELWDVLITGVRVLAKETVKEDIVNEDGQTETMEEEISASHLYGEEGYVLVIDNNPMVSCNRVQEIAEMIGMQAVGLKFRPLAMNIQSDPCIEAGDLATVSDHKGVTYSTILTNVNFVHGGRSSFLCGAISAVEKNSSRPNYLEQKIEQAKQHAAVKIQNQKTELQRITGLVTKSMGIFKSEELKEDGSSIYYLHDKPALLESSTIWKVSAGVFSVSTDGGKTWNAGIDAEGNAVVNLLSAVGINFDWAKGGTLTLGGSSNVNGKLELLANDDTEIIKMDYSGIKLSGGASLISANGVCGNLQYMSNGGAVGILGCALQMSVYHANLYISAFIPDNYVIVSAYLILMTAPATWEKMSGDEVTDTITGYPREIELNYSDNAGLAIWGETYGEYSPLSMNFEPVPSEMLGGLADKPNGSGTATKTIKSEDLSSLLTPGQMNMFEITSKITEDISSDDIWKFTGSGLAVLNIIGYTKN